MRKKETVTILNRPGRTGKLRIAQPEVKVFSWRDGTHVAFDVNSLAALQVSEKLAGRIRKRKLPNLSGVLWTGLAPEFDPPPPLCPVRKIVLNVTHGCNLACTYCFARKHKRMPTMSARTALDALQLFAENVPISVAFFGGEPLLAWDIVTTVAERAIALARERKVGCRLHVTTNGTLIDAVKAAALKRYGFSVLLSLDGPEKIHNETRPAKRGNSFKKTMEALDALNAAGIRPTIRATFTADAPKLIQRLDFFAKLFDQRKISGASVEPVVLSEGCGYGDSQPRAAVPHKPETIWHEAAKWFVRRVKSGKTPFPLHYFRVYLKRFLQGRPAGAECGAGRGYLTIGPKGEMFACHRETHCGIGHVESGFDAAERAKWLDNRIRLDGECGKCWARYWCGGGCRQARLELVGAIDGNTPAWCAERRAILKEVLWIAAQLTRTDALRAAGLAHAETRRPQRKEDCTVVCETGCEVSRQTAGTKKPRKSRSLCTSCLRGESKS